MNFNFIWTQLCFYYYGYSSSSKTESACKIKNYINN